jgi:hypothetical protein
MKIYTLISRRTQITLGVCDSLAAAQVVAEGLSGRELNWREVVNENDDDVALNWLSDDYKWDISETGIITYEDACKTWLGEGS